jgi:AAA domain
MAVKIVSALDILKRLPNIHVYGDNSVGKTHLFATVGEVPEWSPALLISVVSGAKTAASVARKGVDIALCEDYADVRDVVDDLMRSKDYLGYRSVCLDNAHDLNHSMIFNRRRVLREKKSDTTREDPRQWYQEPAMDMRAVVRDLTVMPLTFVLLTLKDEILSDKNDPKSKLMFRPDFTTQMQLEIPGFADILGFMSLESKVERGRKVYQRTIQFKGDKYIWARDNTHSLPDTMDEPTMAKIHECIRKKIQEVESMQQ